MRRASEFGLHPLTTSTATHSYVTSTLILIVFAGLGSDTCHMTYIPQPLLPPDPHSLSSAYWIWCCLMKLMWPP
jgi:hypothetical protein